jgi:hypothetical protein
VVKYKPKPNSTQAKKSFFLFMSKYSVMSTVEQHRPFLLIDTMGRLWESGLKHFSLNFVLAVRPDIVVAILSRKALFIQGFFFVPISI